MQELGTAADTHGQLCGGKRSAHYCDLSRFRWNLFPFRILILGMELSEVQS